jgi:hypothetical protein
MSTRASRTTSTGTGEWSVTKERVLAFADGELRRQGVRFSALQVVYSSDPRYDGLVEVWQGSKGAYMIGVRLPQPPASEAA